MPDNGPDNGPDDSHDSNKSLYAVRSIVEHYAQLKQLQPAEQVVIDLLKDQLSGMKMLDIGVGGGRTTPHFSGRVAEYTGIDYSEDMIRACQQRFCSSSPAVAPSQAVTFEVCDARNMVQFEDDSFDFILFSFNGIDYVSHSDRLKILQEVSRVGKAGGYFCFSSHNLQGMEQAFNWRKQLSLNPVTTYVNLVMLALLRWFNRSIALKQLQTAAHAIIKDESHNFRLQTYYVRPQEQISQLEAFSNVKVYSWRSGLEIVGNELHSSTDLWLYYLCSIS